MQTLSRCAAGRGVRAGKPAAAAGQARLAERGTNRPTDRPTDRPDCILSATERAVCQAVTGLKISAFCLVTLDPVWLQILGCF